MKNIMLIGCGNIGMRHLQAMQKMSLSDSVSITVIEPNPELHNAISEQFDANSSKMLAYSLQQNFPDKLKHVDLAIIATNSRQRKSIFDELISRYSVGSILFEKVLFTNRRDIKEVGEKLSELGISGFVNCARRAFPGYQILKQRLRKNQPLSLEISGANYGLASNGIHFLDLAEYLNDSQLDKLNNDGLDPGFVESKRSGYVEVFGELKGSLANGASISIDCQSEGDLSVKVRIQYEGGEVLVDEAGRTAEYTAAEGTKNTEVFESRFLSETPEVYSDMLFDGPLRMTPFEASARQHVLFIDCIRSHLKLSNAQDEDCPIS